MNELEQQVREAARKLRQLEQKDVTLDDIRMVWRATSG